MIVSITLHGETYERDTAALPQASVDYLLQNGFSQRLRDSYASVTKDAVPDDTERRIKRQAKLADALAQIDSGDVPGTKAPADPAKSRARVVAFMKNLSDADRKALLAEVRA